MDTINDGVNISVFPKRVKETNQDGSHVRFTNNGLAVQIALSDAKLAADYTAKLISTMEFFNSNGNHTILSSCVFLPFGKVWAFMMQLFSTHPNAK
jgi:hypothetical protein